jgi:hypothetical protein
MRTLIKADDGDQITVHADDLSIEQLSIRLELESPAYGISEFDQLTLSTRCARELGVALIQAAELVELNARKLCGTKHFDFISARAGTDSPRRGDQSPRAPLHHGGDQRKGDRVQ